MAKKTGIKGLKAPTLSAYKATTKWSLTKAGKNNLTKIYAYWTWDALSVKDKKERNKDKGTARTDTEDYKRKQWYPCTSTKMRAVSVYLQGRVGGKKWKKTKPATTELTVPAKPGASVSVTQNTGTVNFSITAKADHGTAERYDTRMVVTREANTGTTSATLADTSTLNTSWTGSYNISDANSLDPGEYIKISLDTWNRGLRGDSAHNSASHVFAQPAVAQIITGDTVEVGYSGSTADGGQAYIDVQTNSAWNHPVDTVTLQVLRSSAATTAEAAGALESWQDVQNASDDANCTGLVCPLTDCWPDAGTRTWFRLKTTHDNYTVYGTPVVLGYYEPPKTEVVASGRAQILVNSGGTLTRSGDDGKSAVIVVAFDAADDNTGTEISWSKYEDAWQSTDAPNTYEVTWEDSTSQSSSATLPDSSTLYVRGLDQNTPYYFKARRYLVDAEGDTIYGEYNGPVTVVPVSAPSSVVLTANSPYVPRGQGVTLTWSFDSDAPQEWYDIDGGSKHWSGRDSLGSLAIPAEDLAGADTWTFAVTMSTGGAAVTSESITVYIVDAPTCTLALPFGATLTAQPATLAITADKPGCAITASIVADGGLAEYPDREVIQAQGDIVWGGYIEAPEWTDNGDDTYTATVELPDGLLFIDGCDYTANAGVTDLSTGLSATAGAQSFDVEWAHQADAGSATIAVDSSAMTATLTTAASSGYAMGDVCDVYRVTPDGAYRITPAIGVAYGSTVTDTHAPFGTGDLRYAIATRTPDGDVDYGEVEYTLDGKSLVFDWDDGQQLAMPYNPTQSDAFAKDFESRAHMGERTAAGYWGESVERTGSLTGVLLRADNDSIELLRDLAHYPGAAFVRVPNGLAYPANVDVSEISEGYDQGWVAVSFDTSEVTITDEFRASIDSPDWTGGALQAYRGQVYDTDGGFPLLAWTWLGYHGSTGYAYDPDTPQIVDSAGTVMTGYTWDGLTLLDANDNEITLTEEAE